MSKESGALAGIQRQIMWNRLISVVEEQAQVMIRTAFSTTVREAGDLSAGIFDMHGRMMAQAVTGTPGHVNSMARSVIHFIREFPVDTMKPGDAYVTNDPWKGTGHLYDIVVTSPAFHDGKLVALFSCTTHVVDIGGLGQSPDGRQVYHEGLFLPLLPLMREGKMDESVMRIIRSNVRESVQVEGDIHALIGCNLIGEKPDPKLIELLSNELHVTPETPPTFLFHTNADTGVLPENSVRFYLALRKARVPAEMHIFENGPHGVGLALGDPALGQWPVLLTNWLRGRGLLTRSQ